MKKIDFSLITNKKENNNPTNEIEDEDKKLTPIDSLPNDENLKMNTESFENTNEDKISHTIWGSSEVQNCMGMGQQIPKPPYVLKKGRDEKYYLHLFQNTSMTPAEGQIHQFLSSLTESDIIHIYIHEVPFHRLTLLQSAILNCKAETHTHVHMIEADSWESPKFFLWMTGKVLEPIPYSMIGLVEPKTIFSFGGTTSENRKDAITFDDSVKQKMYDHAVQKGLLKLDEIAILNEGRMVLIKDINERIKIANSSNIQ